MKPQITYQKVNVVDQVETGKTAAAYRARWRITQSEVGEKLGHTGASAATVVHRMERGQSEPWNEATFDEFVAAVDKCAKTPKQKRK